MGRAIRPGSPPLRSGALFAAAVPHALAAGTILRLILVAIAALAVYVLIVLAHPTKRCGKCQGQRVIVPAPGKRGRPKPCKRCKVTGRHYRFGATAIHRFKWSVINGRHHTRLDGK